MNRRTLGVLAIALFIVTAASADQSGISIHAASGSGFTSWAQSEITAADGVQLRKTFFKKEFKGVSYSFINACPGYSEIPDQVEGTSSFCYASLHPPSGFFEVDTGFFFYYDIYLKDATGAWQRSGYWLDGAAKVSLFGEPLINCTIKQSGSTVPASGAPFQCEAWLTGGGNTASPHWKITAKPLEVIDAADSANVTRAAQLIGDNCHAFDTPRCDWTRTQKSSAFLPDQKDWQSLTNWADSCPPVDPSKLTVLGVNRSVQISWSDKVGGKIAGKITADAFAAKVEASVEANYEHTITQSDTYGESYTYTIPYKYRSALYLQHGMLQVTGDFSIISATGDRYLVKNAVFQFPLQKDVQVEGRGQPVPRGVVQHVDIPCSQTAPSVATPPPANATVGLAAKAK